MNQETQSKRWIWRVGVPIGALLMLWLGIGLGRCTKSPVPANDGSRVETTAGQQTWWTCAMHPQIRMPNNDKKCPICHMDLVPVSAAADPGLGSREVGLTERARALSRIETSPVSRRPLSMTVRLFGRVDYDETRLATIASWVNGRIDRMYVDYTGIAVKKGDHLVRLYSPELLTTQRELLSAARSTARYGAGDKSPAAKVARSLLAASRERLRLWGLGPAQIDRIAGSGKPTEHITIYAPLGGVVIVKNGQEGMYVKTGTRLYTIADLSTVWIQLEAFESDLPWLRYGQAVSLETKSLPGRQIEGRISFIDPFVDADKRTARVRIVVPNPDGSLRPGMYVSGQVTAGLDGRGLVIGPNLRGKWIGPMHPEIIRDQPGRCPTCGMNLVPAAELGLVSDEGPQEAPLVIPKNAPLITGRRAVVYVEVPDRDKPTYEGREVELGPRGEDGYVVLGGLREGEQVVREGAFRLDSAMQIQAKPSMMNPAGGGPAPGHAHLHPAERPQDPSALLGVADKPPPKPQRLTVSLAFQKSLMPFADSYAALQQALAADDETAALKAAAGLVAAGASLSADALREEAARRRFAELGQAARAQLQILGQQSQLGGLRQAFSPLSNTWIRILTEFGFPAGRSFFRVHCPMAFDNRGAWWVQADDRVANPYFGAAMLTCADVTAPIQPGSGP